MSASSFCLLSFEVKNNKTIYINSKAQKRKKASRHTGGQLPFTSCVNLSLRRLFPRQREFSQGFLDFQTEVKYILVEEEMFSRLFGLFSAICLILCLLSMYSAITMNTEKRRKEVAIRKINGAEIKNIILFFSKNYIKLWSIICVLLFPVIYFAGNRWLETFTLRISLNLFFFSGVYFSILALIFLIILFRIIDVARCNPADVLKSD